MSRNIPVSLELLRLVLRAESARKGYDWELSVLPPESGSWLISP
jgi:hypothetical protein